MSTLPAAHVSSQICRECSVESSFCPLWKAGDPGSPDRRDGLSSTFDGLRTSVPYAAGAVVFHELDACHSVFVICSGRVKLVTGSREGRVLLLRYAEPGQVLGLAEAVLGGACYECTAIAVEPSVVGVIPRDTFMRFVASYPQAARRVTVALSDQYRAAQHEEKLLGFGESSTVRLVHLLLGWAEERGSAAADGVHIPLHVTHSDLAQAIGSTRETVTRILRDLTLRGVVDRMPREIVIHSLSDLSRLSW